MDEDDLKKIAENRKQYQVVSKPGEKPAEPEEKESPANVAGTAREARMAKMAERRASKPADAAEAAVAETAVAPPEESAAPEVATPAPEEAAPETAVATPAFLAEHTVASGETLSHIAQKYYKSAVREKWMAIYEANKETIGNNPSLIRVGQVLKIPQL